MSAMDRDSIVCVGLCDQISFGFILCKKGWVLLHPGECSDYSDCSVVKFYGVEYLTEWNGMTEL